jgi:vacuolar-type H+-ATPase subunit I/STV1
MFPWKSIVSKQTLEPYVSEGQSQSIVGSVFIGIGTMVFATAVTLMFYWAYQQDKTLFIAILCGLVFLYSIKMLILVSVLRNKLNPIVFKFYIGSTIFMSILTLILIVYFAIKASQRMRGPSSSYVPPPVSSYLDAPAS